MSGMKSSKTYQCGVQWLVADCREGLGGVLVLLPGKRSDLHKSHLIHCNALHCGYKWLKQPNQKENSWNLTKIVDNNFVARNVHNFSQADKDFGFICYLSIKGPLLSISHSFNVLADFCNFDTTIHAGKSWEVRSLQNFSQDEEDFHFIKLQIIPKIASLSYCTLCCSTNFPI